jgi:biopolymer transport protein ExbB/TolQ
MFDNFDWLQAMRTSPVMLIILVCSIVTVGFALERGLYYWRRRGRADNVLSMAVEAARSGHVKEAAFRLAATRHPVGPVAAEVLLHMNDTPEAQESRLHIALSEQRMLFEKHLSWLGTMGNTAPLIGLLGTVWGIMRAFHDMARTGSAGPSVVAAGVAEALFTTAAGLLVAVPAVMIYNHFVQRMSVVLNETENQARRLRLALDEVESQPHNRSESPARRAS